MSISIIDRLRELIKPIDKPPVRTFKMADITEEGIKWFGTVVPEVDFRVLEAEHARLAPLLEAMVKCVEELKATVPYLPDAELAPIWGKVDRALTGIEQVLTKLEGE